MNTLTENRRKKLAELKQTINNAQAEIVAVVDASAKSHIAASYPYVSAIHVQFDDRYDGTPSAHTSKITLINGASFDVSSGYIEPGYEDAVRALGHAPEPDMLSEVEEIMAEGIDARWVVHNVHHAELTVNLTVNRLVGKLA